MKYIEGEYGTSPDVIAQANEIADQAAIEYATEQAIQTEVELGDGFSALAWFRRSRWSGGLVIGGAAAAVGGGVVGEAILATPVVAESTPVANTTASDFSPQKCTQHGVSKPTISKPPVMNHAGIRPFTPHHYYIQNISGELGYVDISKFCPPESNRVRVSHGQIEMKTADGQWVSLGPPNNPVYIGNGSGAGELNYSPSHAWPDFVFNSCVKGKFRKVRVILDESLKNTQNHEVVANREYILPVPVHGGCVAAEKSAKATKDIRQNWG